MSACPLAGPGRAGPSPRIRSLATVGRTASVLVVFAASAGAQGSVVGWGQTQFQKTYAPAVVQHASLGAGHALVVRDNGSLFAWGEFFGTPAVAPMVTPGQTATKVESGNFFCAALLSNGSIVASGSNTSGQANVPPPTPGHVYVDLSLGGAHGLGLLDDGSLISWGSSTTVPALPAGVTFTRINAFLGVSAACLSDGTAIVWGDATPGQLAVPALPGGLTYVEVAVGDDHVVALLSNGDVIGWGGNAFGQSSPPPSANYLQVDAGNGFSVALRSDGQAIVWGFTPHGLDLVPSLPAGTTYADVDAAFGGLLAVRSDGEVVLWGLGSNGFADVPISAVGLYPSKVDFLFDTSLTFRSDGKVSQDALHGSSQATKLPPPTAGETWVDVTGSLDTSLVAVSSDGSILALFDPNVIWGTFDPPSGIKYVQAAKGNFFFAALRSDGRADGFGNNDYGQTELPIPPAGLSYLRVEAGYSFTILLRSDGELILAGSILGSAIVVPPLPPGTKYVDVRARYQQIIALRSDGQVVAFGNGAHAQNVVPPLPPGTYYVEVATSGLHSLARRSDGAVVSWGLNLLGEGTVPAAPPGQSYAGLGATWYQSAGILRPSIAGQATGYCAPAAANSVSPSGAKLRLAGSVSHTFNDTVLAVDDLPPNALGIFLYGPQQASLPFGNGTLCVGGAVNRILPPSFADANGDAARFLDLDEPAFAMGPGAIQPGSTWNFQFWYRDTLAPPAFFNLSSAAQLVFAP